ncbi:MAG: hypothetical protein ACE1Z4_05325 [Gammaproteobacteria bacterium]
MNYVKRLDGKGYITMAGRPIPAEWFDDDPTWSALEEVARIPEPEIDKIIEKLGLGDFLRARRST